MCLCFYSASASSCDAMKVKWDERKRKEPLGQHFMPHTNTLSFCFCPSTALYSPLSTVLRFAPY